MKITHSPLRNVPILSFALPPNHKMISRVPWFRKVAWLLFATGVLAGARPSQAVPMASHPVEFSTAGFFSAPGSPREVYDFNPGWRFLKGEAKGAELPAFDDSGWERVNTPHGLEILPENASGGRNYQGPAWYRKKFSVPAESDGKRKLLYFEAAMGKCQVWVNGKAVKEHFGGYLPFGADITDYLQPGGTNLVAVRVDNSDDPSYPPGLDQRNLDFTYLGGIYRDVFLICIAPVHVTLPELSHTVAGGGVFVGVTEASGTLAKAEVRTEIANQSTHSEIFKLRTILEDPDGRELLRSEQSAEIAAGSSRTLADKLDVKNVRLWYPNDPYLHFIRTEVLVQGRLVDSFRTRFGFRLFEMRGKEGFFVNGKLVGNKLMGVNRHQDYVYVGNALPKSGQWRDAKILREGGNSVIRAAHYPLSPAFLDACDEMGLLVSDANPGWHFFNLKKPELFSRRMEEDTRAMVRRDRNRPSLLFWETALNETGYQPKETVVRLHRAAHEEFPYPGLFTVADPELAKPAGLDISFGDGKDAAGKNGFIREYGDGLDNFYGQNSVIRLKRENGEGPLLLNSSLRTGCLDNMWALPRECIGAALWAGIDHQRGYFPLPFYGGLVDLYRIPRYSFYVFQSQYNADLKIPYVRTGAMVYIAHELTQASAPDVNVYSNCEQVRLIWRGKDFGIHSPEKNHKHLPHPPFVFHNVFNPRDVGKWNWQTRSFEDGPANMIAEGLIAGKVVCRSVKTYPMRLTKVKLTVDGQGIPLVADGSDFIPIRAELADADGNLKTMENEYVFCEVEGPSEIIGGTYNQANPMKTQFGTATFLIRAKTLPGKIKVKAWVPGLDPGTTEITSIPSNRKALIDEAYANATEKHLSQTSRMAPLRSPKADGNDTSLQKIGREQQHQAETNVPTETP